MLNTFIYLKNFITDKYVASITPTSRYAVEKVCGKIDFNGRQVIVEYGPGTGVFTENLLRNMSAKSRLIAIERNPSFYQILQREFVDSRLKVVHDCASNVKNVLQACGEKEVDYIVSGIPFSLLSMEMKLIILKNAYSVLKEGGRFLAYQNFFQLPEFLKNHMERTFQNIRTQYVLQSLPPLVVLEAVKANGSSGIFQPHQGSAI
ncbi:MAG: methyltransferase domain-containing protein [Deltaproteobacteria bacterium]|nr:methyltransferase domain-containing protein [Deltaproteobacteria bacterium]